MAGDWPEISLGEVAKVRRGLAYAGQQLAPPGRPFVTLKCFERGGGFRPAGLKTFSGAVPVEFQLRGGELLIANTDLTRDAVVVGAPALAPDFKDDPGAFSMDVSQLVTPASTVDNRFLAARLSSSDARSFMQARAAGSTVLHLQVREVPDFRFRLPPLVEQRRIAEVLDTLDEAIQRTEQVNVKLNQMKQGLLHDLLTRGLGENGELRDPERHPEQFKSSPLGPIPCSWTTSPIGVVAKFVDPNPSHRYPTEVPAGVPIASTENFVGDDEFDLSGSKQVPEHVYAAQAARCGFAAEDVVFARKGRIGFARPYGSDRKVFSHTVVVVKAVEGRTTPRFLLWTMRSTPFFRGIRDQMNTNLGVPTLGVGFLSGVVVAVPPVGEQRRSADTLDALEGQVRAEEAFLAKLVRLKHGLAEDLLTGRVRIPGSRAGAAT